MPLKAVRGDEGVGKVDLLGLCDDGVLAVIELKLASSREDRRIALLEGLVYAAIVEANIAKIAAEVAARVGSDVKAIRPKLFIVAPTPYWADTRAYPTADATASLAAAVSARISTEIVLLSMEGGGATSLGLDGSKPTVADDIALVAVATTLSAAGPPGDAVRDGG